VISCGTPGASVSVSGARADVERLAGLDGNRRLVATVAGMLQCEHVPAGVERRLERRDAGLLAVDEHARAGGYRLHRDAGEGWLQRHRQRLRFAATDHEKRLVMVFVPRRPDQQLARPGGQLELTGQGTGLATVHSERRTDSVGVDADPARQALQRHDDLLAVGARDLDVERGRLVAGGGDEQRVATRQHQLALADSQVERRTGKIDTVGLHLGNGAHGDRH
jgi:hypothetical protein